MVGSCNKAKEFFIHRSLLTRNSRFFTAALDGQFKEGNTQVVNFPEESPDTFAFFAQWLYTHDLKHEALDVTEQSSVQGNEGSRKATKPAYFKLLHLYALADRLGVEAIRNEIVNKVMSLAEETNSVPTPTDTWVLYENIRDGAPIRKLVVDLFACMHTNTLLDTHEDDWHERFLRDLVLRLRRKPKVEGAALRNHSWGAVERCTPTQPIACHRCKLYLCEFRICKTCSERYCGTCSAGLFSCPNTAGTGGGIKSWDECDYHEHQDTERCTKEIGVFLQQLGQDSGGPPGMFKCSILHL